MGGGGGVLKKKIYPINLPQQLILRLKSVDYQKIVEHLNKDSTEEKFHVVEFKILDQV